jgi:hypothetical protein
MNLSPRHGSSTIPDLGGKYSAELTEDAIMRAIEQDRFDTLKSLSPLEAIRAWVSETIGPGDRSALALAIQRDRRIELDDDEIAYLVQDGIECGLDARSVLERLLSAGDGVQARSDASSSSSPSRL